MKRGRGGGWKGRVVCWCCRKEKREDESRVIGKEILIVLEWLVVWCVVGGGWCSGGLENGLNRESGWGFSM